MRRHMVVLLAILVAVLCVSVNVAFGKKPSSEPGQQMITARWTDTAPGIDGAIGPGEYSAAIPLHVTFVQPTYPGVVPDLGTEYEWPWPENPDDLSYTIYAMYDEDNLYIAVDVADDYVIDDGPDCFGAFPWWDDDVEIFVDGDRVGNDITDFFAPGKEGFQLVMDAGGDAWATPGDADINAVIDWEAAPGLRPRGYMVEFRIALSSIDTEDDGDETPPGPGSKIGFNVVAGDDDNGSLPYNWGQFDCVYWSPDEELTDTFGMWDGSATFLEDDWGTLYFDPKWAAKPALSLQPSTWGWVKSLLK